MGFLEDTTRRMPVQSSTTIQRVSNVCGPHVKPGKRKQPPLAGCPYLHRRLIGDWIDDLRWTDTRKRISLTEKNMNK